MKRMSKGKRSRRPDHRREGTRRRGKPRDGVVSPRYAWSGKHKQTKVRLLHSTVLHQIRSMVGVVQRKGGGQHEAIMDVWLEVFDEIAFTGSAWHGIGVERCETITCGVYSHLQQHHHLYLGVFLGLRKDRFLFRSHLLTYELDTPVFLPGSTE